MISLWILLAAGPLVSQAMLASTRFHGPLQPSTTIQRVRSVRVNALPHIYSPRDVSLFHGPSHDFQGPCTMRTCPVQVDQHVNGNRLQYDRLHDKFKSERVMSASDCQTALSLLTTHRYEWTLTDRDFNRQFAALLGRIQGRGYFRDESGRWFLKEYGVDRSIQHAFEGLQAQQEIPATLAVLFRFHVGYFAGKDAQGQRQLQKRLQWVMGRWVQRNQAIRVVQFLQALVKEDEDSVAVSNAPQIALKWSLTALALALSDSLDVKHRDTLKNAMRACLLLKQAGIHLEQEKSTSRQVVYLWSLDQFIPSSSSHFHDVYFPLPNQMNSAFLRMMQ